ncbi:PASTA domain-containing protein [Solwaraspora sp. WMMD792]|uniref:PASTA domain-containing protein n=1 Tax=Solwaraspora sp. WMMD792 TaxID=3016099 RepID=UPI002415D0B9|nr:PASTA domain-containing protein [Solwaraspora sp. WMMD792]MDG4774006.1 PASTA domain-containing protein [Solwaraspora sp. WMMD792]
MADRPRDPAEDGSAGRDAGDYTSQLPRPVDPWATRAGGPADQAGESTGQSDQPPGRPGTPGGDPGATVADQGGHPGSTAPDLPADSAAGGAREPAWSGRAGVPVRPAAGGGGTGDWPGPGGGTEGGGRPWWLPILIGVLVLLLVALVGLVIWWASTLDDSTDPGGPTPTAAPTATVPTSQPETEQPEPTEEQPEPTEEQTSEAPLVVVPTLTGLSLADARAELDERDLVYRLEQRGSDQPAGTVLETDPPAGTEVPPGTEILLVIAATNTEPTGPADPTGAAEPTGEPGDGDED